MTGRGHSFGGVREIGGGRFEYPSNLTPPRAPVAPPTDNTLMNQAGLKLLLDNESPEVVGKRIEDAIVSNLGLKIVFKNP